MIFWRIGRLFTPSSSRLAAVWRASVALNETITLKRSGSTSRYSPARTSARTGRDRAARIFCKACMPAMPGSSCCDSRAARPRFRAPVPLPLMRCRLRAPASKARTFFRVPPELLLSYRDMIASALRLRAAPRLT